tara:strand:+ start:1964 stop:2515 length:552 start_codon:yes stop_codon:yes gene_type:complete
MYTKNIERYLNSFGKQVVNRSIANLGKKKGGKTALSQSIKFEVKKDTEGFVVKFFMYDYGTFLDKGVSGAKKNQSFTNYEKKKESSPYKFGSGSSPVSKAKGGMSGIMTKWIKKKGFQWKDKKTGRFMSHKSMGYIVARSIYRDGIKSLSFFQKPLGLAWKDFATLSGNALKEDIIESLKIVK